MTCGLGLRACRLDADVACVSLPVQPLHAGVAAGVQIESSFCLTEIRIHESHFFIQDSHASLLY